VDCLTQSSALFTYLTSSSGLLLKLPPTHQRLFCDLEHFFERSVSAFHLRITTITTATNNISTSSQQIDSRCHAIAGRAQHLQKIPLALPNPRNQTPDSYHSPVHTRDMDSSTDGSGVNPPASRPDMPSVMAAKVFDVPELREHIILSLSEHDILTSAQRVSRAWKASVDASPQIQRKLLLLRTGTGPTVTPIRFFSSQNWIEEVPTYDAAVKFNSLLKKASRLLPGCEIDGHPEPIGLWPSGHWHMHHEIEASGKADGTPAFSDRSDRSWRKMQVCDPPISVLSLLTLVQPYTDEEEPEICAAVLDRDGVTMGLLYDTAAAMLRGTDSSYPFFRLSFGIDIPNELPQTNDAGDSDDGIDGGNGGGGEDRRGQGDDRDETGRGSSSNGDDERGDDHGGYGRAWDAQVNRIMDSFSSARSRALAIPELLENIISFLPEREILTNAQRVSRTWRTSVAEPPRIQRQLFLPKGKKPAVSPMRFTDDNLWGEMSEDFGIPIYKQSVVSNHLLKSADHLYADYLPVDNGYT
jgi:hypothetical protein